MNWIKIILSSAILGFTFAHPVKSQEVGQALTPCALSELNGSKEPLDLKKFKGHVIYIDFWASWCPPCVKSFPFLNGLHKQYHSEGLQIIGINLDEITEDAKNFVTKNPVDFILATDDTKLCAKDLGVAAMPTSYLIDRQGVIRHIHLGFRSGQADELCRQVKKLLSEPAVI